MPNQSQKHSLFPFVQNNEEQKIVECVENSVLISRIKNENDILSVVAKWRMYCGLPKQDVSEEVAMVRDFIIENYGFLTISEIELAYKLATLNKLDDAEFYGHFSPIYISKVLNSYLYYRKKTLAEAIRRKEKYETNLLIEKNKPTPEEEAELTKKIFKDFYEQHKSGKDINDILNICWTFLRKYKMIKPTKDEIADAIKYGEQKAKDNEQTIWKFYETSGIDREVDVRRFARNYCVQRFFEKTDIEKFLDDIKPELFL